MYQTILFENEVFFANSLEELAESIVRCFNASSYTYFLQEAVLLVNGVESNVIIQCEVNNNMSNVTFAFKKGFDYEHISYEFLIEWSLALGANGHRAPKSNFNKEIVAVSIVKF